MYGKYDIVVFGYGSNPAENMTRQQMKTAMRKKARVRPAVPEKYSNETTSGLSDTVDGEHSGFHQIELTD